MTTLQVNLNRLFTISAASSKTAFVPNDFIYCGYSADEPVFLGNSCRFGADGLTAGENPPAMASAWSGVTALYLPFYFPPFDESPDPTPNLAELPSGSYIRVSALDSPDSYIEWEVGEIELDRQYFYTIPVSAYALVNGDFAFYDGADGFECNIRIEFEGFGTQESLTKVESKRVWGAMTERGSQAGFVTLEGSDIDAAQEEAEFITRYDSGLANGKTLIDDLGREWNLANSRTIYDRRYMLFEGFRHLATDSIGE